MVLKLETNILGPNVPLKGESSCHPLATIYAFEELNRFKTCSRIKFLIGLIITFCSYVNKFLTI